MQNFLFMIPRQEQLSAPLWGTRHLRKMLLRISLHLLPLFPPPDLIFTARGQSLGSLSFSPSNLVNTTPEERFEANPRPATCSTMLSSDFIIHSLITTQKKLRKRLTG